jgi:hypothetical protein
MIAVARGHDLLRPPSRGRISGGAFVPQIARSASLRTSPLTLANEGQSA